jgi:mitogen-activated protein kinase kinase kinase
MLADAQDFLLKTFDLDYKARPDAGELLQHPWIAVKKLPLSNKGNTLKPPPAIKITA